MSLRRRMRERGLDAVTLLVIPGVVFVLALFIYPFLYGLVLSFTPKEGGWLANYQRFFSDPFLYDTIYLTLQIAVPVTLLNTVLSVPVALRVRLMKRQRLLTTILVIPITLGTVMVAEGLLTYLGPRGWLNRFLLEFGTDRQPGAADPQLLGRDAVAGDQRLPVHLPADAVLCHRHRSVAGAGRRDAGRARAAALLPHPAAAAGAGAGDHAGAGVRAGVHRVPVRRAAGRAGRTDAGDLHRRVSGGVRAVRLFARLGDRDADGRRAGDHHRGTAGRAHRWCSAAPPAPARAERDASQSRRKAVVDRRLGGGGVLHHQPAGDDRQRGGEFVRHALVQHLAAGRLHDAMVHAGMG